MTGFSAAIPGDHSPVRRNDGSPIRLLVVDDESVLADLLFDSLRFAGFDVSVARDGTQALNAVQTDAPDLVILDVNLPDVDGFTITQRLRGVGNNTPIIYLTARDDPNDLRNGFRAGGDDYLTKPFSLEELKLRIEAVLRRSLGASSPTTQLACADLTLDVDSHEVRRGGQAIELSPTEFRLLHYLLLNQGRVLSKAQILRHVWDYDFGGDTSLVETYISYLRRKIDDSRPKLIHTVRGLGYVLRKSDVLRNPR